MSRLRWRTTAISIAGLNTPAEGLGIAHEMRDSPAEISFLLGMQAILGQEPPIHLAPRPPLVAPLLPDARR
jgi:hypothetical protein